MAEFGEQLRRERERRGVSVEAICAATKISAKHIRALEAGDFAKLPGGVIRRGFVRSYLGVLGLEEDVWLERFEQSCRESGLREPTVAEWGRFAENVKNGRSGIRRRMGLMWLVLVALLVALAMAGWCGWRFASHRKVPIIPGILVVLNSSVDNERSR
ncbi:MAG: helix-turn-helix domain-containing protein [Acidobacteriaceae bacterium]|nr:helix-turn-helix domain-containing protein [Acidobacteriaceae bacterium]